MHYERGRDRMVRGADWNKVIAYYPQSSSAGNLFDACLLLMDPESQNYYVGDVYHGKTPIRALIHDEILFEVPKDKLDFFLFRCRGAMEYPIYCQPLRESWNMGQFMAHKVDIKVGNNWADMEIV
jgi:hypothetical protein